MSQRKYALSQKKLIAKGRRVAVLCERDFELLTSLGLTQEKLTEFNELIKQFILYKSDEQILKVQSEITGRKKKVFKNLLNKIRATKLRWNLIQPEKANIISVLNKALQSTSKEKEFIGCLNEIISDYRDITDGQWDELITQITLYLELQNELELMKAERKQMSEVRLRMSNAIYQNIKDLTKIGKAYWVDKSKSKYKEYHVYIR